MEYSERGWTVWRRQHRRLYDEHKMLLLGDYTTTTEHTDMLVFVRFSKKSYTHFHTSRAMRRIEYYSPVCSQYGVMLALTSDDTTVPASDMISAKGWINRAILKVQRQFRTRVRTNRMIINNIVPRQLRHCDNLLRHVVEFMPAPVVVTPEEMKPLPLDNRWTTWQIEAHVLEDIRHRRSNVPLFMFSSLMQQYYVRLKRALLLSGLACRLVVRAQTMGDTSVLANDMSKLTGWVWRAIGRFQMQFRTRRRRSMHHTRAA